MTAAGSFVVHYPELALKGRNRPWFVDTLVRHLRSVLRPLGAREVRAIASRIEIVLRAGADDLAIRERLRHTFGVANFGRALRCAPAIDAILDGVVAVLGSEAPESFRVRARRGDKQFPLTSPEIERLAGERIIERRGWRVDLSAPALTVFVEVVKGAAFCTAAREQGPGGLPVGVSGNVICLLSGGIDSPVAAWRMMGRGCRAHAVHFHSHPLTSGASQDTVRLVAARLARYQPQVRLSLVPLADIQRHVVSIAPPAFRTLLYRRFMVRIAERLAHCSHAQAIVTGDAVGQVASQTLDNLAAIDAIATLPVLRPLVGFAKEEIIAEARRLGTYGLSIAPADDCCQLFAPRRVATDAISAELDEIERRIDVGDLVSSAVRATVHERVEAAWESTAQSRGPLAACG
jgi:thiamine biosynthesis protein ThiI